MNRIVYAPFSDDQILALNRHQTGSRPILCPEHAWNGVLVAMMGGWRCPVAGCTFMQLWALGAQFTEPRTAPRQRRGG